MRLRYFLDRFQVRISIGEGENLAGPVRPFGLQGHPAVTEDGPRIVTTLEPHAKPRRHPVLENFEQQEHAVAGVDALNLFMGSMLVTACMTMAVVMVLASAQQPGSADRLR